jgi:hypothetical protein
VRADANRLSLYLDFTFALKPVVKLSHQDADLSGFFIAAPFVRWTRQKLHQRLMN